jgi:glucose-6-phosphate isomerase
MVHINTSSVGPFITSKEVNLVRERTQASLSQLQNKTGKGPEWIGWRDILSNPNDALLNQIETIAQTIRRDADVFIVCGIGGSYLGAKAVIDALGSFFPDKRPEIIYAGHHMSGRYLKELVAYLSAPNSDGTPKSVYLNVISKSGTTTETAIAFRVLREWIHTVFPNDASSRIICTTSARGGALNRIIEANGYTKFVLPDDIGGRFSVLTPVGLLPIAVAGNDIRALFYGAVSCYRSLEKDPEVLVDYVAHRTTLYEKGYCIDIIATFEPELAAFGGWMQQLMGESEGKNHKGLYPSVHTYSTDLHSLGQMVQDGQRNLLETFLVVDKDAAHFMITEDSENHDGLNYLAGKSLHEINKKAWQGTTQAHNAGGVPVIQVHIPAVNEDSIGALIYFFELATAVYVYNLGENPFDQPGVEDYKKAMFKLLGKPD